MRKLIFLFLIALLNAGSLLEARTLTVWAMGEEGLRIAGMARQFEKENPGVKVVTQAIPWDAAHEKLLTSVVGGLPPDVSQMGTTWMAEFSALGSLEPLEPYIENSSVVKKENFFEGSWKTVMVKGQVCGVPWYVDTRVLFYRKDLLAEAGFAQAPRTWEELRAACKALARDTNGDGQFDKFGISLPVRGWGMLLPFVWQNGGDALKPESQEFREAFDFYVSFFKDNLAPTGRAADLDLFQAFKSGFYPMFVSGPWMVELVQKELPELDGKWGVSVVPGKKRRTSFVGGCNLVVFKDSKEKDLAWKFVEFMSRPENQIEWYGMLKSLPAVRKAWEAPVLRDHPVFRIFGEQMKDTESPPVIPEWEQLAYAVDGRMEKRILGERPEDKDSVRVLSDMEKDMNAILSKRELPKMNWGRFALTAGVITASLFGIFFMFSKKKKPEAGIPHDEAPKDWRRALSQSFVGYCFVLPSIVILVLFLFLPIVLSFFISLTNWNIYGLADKNMVSFVGLANYARVLTDPVFWKSLMNTAVFSVVGVPLTITISLYFATVLNEKIVHFKTFFRAAYFLPVVSTIVAVAVVWRWMYNPEYGLLNYFLIKMSFKPLNWLADPRTALLSLIFMAAWKGFGYNMVIFLAGLQNIPESLYEAARIDGANTWQLFRHVTLPGLKPTLVFVIIMSTIGYLQFFAEPYVMTKGGPLDSTMSIVLYMYNQGFKFFELGYASAVAYVLFGIIFAVTLIQIRIRRGFEVE